MRSVKSVLLLALVVGGCSSDGLGPKTVIGNWVQDFTVPGSFTEMNLMSTGSIVSGTGDWCAEAGPCGNIAVSGTTTGVAVHLDLVFTSTFPPGIFPAFEDHFDGVLISSGSLKGSLTAVIPGQPPGTAFPTGFHRG
jgi:hypothetical protein